MPHQATEDDIVDMLRRRFGRKAPGVEMGIGDDGAVIHTRAGKERWVLTTDMLVEDVDFRRGWQTQRQLGWKSLAVNFSDLAAMGARPRFYTASLALPRDLKKEWIRQFYEGLEEAAARDGATLIGGDLSRSSGGIQISITAVGESLDRKILYRSGGRAGDIVYVTGVLGKAAAGLALLGSGRKRGETHSEREALKAFRTPVPRCEEGMWLASSGMVRAAMDLSDGLSMDLPRLCRSSGTGAEIYDSQLPVFVESGNWGCDPLELALNGGEDFELLFVVSPGRVSRLEKTYPSHFPPIRRIGRLTSCPGQVTRTGPGGRMRPLLPLGFDHFRR